MSGRIIIVEDEPAVRRLVGRILAKAGFEIEICSSIADAASFLAAERTHVDLVVVGLVHSQNSVESLVSSLRGLQDGLGILALTGFSGAPHESGPGLRVLQKPFDEESLLSAVRKLLTELEDGSAEGVRIQTRILGPPLLCEGELPIGIAHARAMTRRDLHRGETLVTVFGHHPVREALRSKGADVLELRWVAGTGAKEYRGLRHEATTSGIAVGEISRSEMNAYAGAPRHDQGIAARVRLLRVIETETFLENLKGKNAGRPARVMALDGVTNSQNVGMVVRSVVGAGLSGMLWPMVGQPWVNGLLIRAAAGSIFECPIIRCDSLVFGLAAFQAAGFSCLGLDSGASSSLFSMSQTHREVYVLGSESSGLSAEIQSLVDTRVSIPMAGALESLNVAVAAGLVCFHAGGLLNPKG